MVVRAEINEEQLASRPDHLWPEIWKTMGKNAKLKEKQKWSNEKLHLENARKLRGIYFIEPGGMSRHLDSSTTTQMA